MSTHVLIVDDETFVRDSLTEILRAEGFVAHAAANVDGALALLHAEPVEVVVCDLRMPRKDGLALLREARHAGTRIPVVLLTGHGTVADAVAAMKEGAFDFLQKPAEPGALVRVVRRAAEHFALVRELRSLRGRQAVREPERRLVGSSPALQHVRELIEQLARSDVGVLISGESGTGKELAATEIHRQSRRAAAPCVFVSCATLAAAEFESALFGCGAAAPGGEREGALAAAEGGTLVLDEIVALDAQAQLRLLRFLETGEVRAAGGGRARTADVRVLATTNQDLAAAVAAGRLRADLYHRLAVFLLALPPLCEHKEDLGEIARALLLRAEARKPFGGGEARLADDALEVLARYDWPGNVRELENVLERAQILARGGKLDGPLFASLLETTLPAPRTSSSAQEFHLRQNLDALEKELVQRALAHTGNKKKEASQLLGIDPRNLGYYLRKHGLRD